LSALERGWIPGRSALAAGTDNRMNIVAGYVPTDLGEEVLRQAMAEAELRGSHLVVVNSSRGDAAIDDRFAQGETLERLTRHLEASGIDFDLRQPVRGHNADEEVLDVADEVGAELLVIGVRHRSPVGKLIMGSTSQKILLGSTCPVLAVKAPS
jgi:nucleotide-binding universal stress UspA family protein